MCGVPALTGAVVRTLEPPSAVTVKWSPAPACALLCPVCSDQGENISPAQRPPDGEDGIHYTIYILSLYFIVYCSQTRHFQNFEGGSRHFKTLRFRIRLGPEQHIMVVVLIRFHIFPSPDGFVTCSRSSDEAVKISSFASTSGIFSF